ncbi:MAG: hypothetical protein LQ340_000599 [Diploschistes diacapsis]|nr:MAG: hypothetical protein LQ340_000599 [Diploschistes diacapsis]
MKDPEILERREAQAFREPTFTDNVDGVETREAQVFRQPNFTEDVDGVEEREAQVLPKALRSKRLLADTSQA